MPLAQERQQELLDLLNAGSAVVVSDLARNWGVSEMTVRRDLKRLQDEGLAARVHGGAVAAGHLSFRSRQARNQGAKRAAAAKLSAYLPEKGCIYLDGSTTIHHLVEHLKGRNGLRVASNNIETFEACSGIPGINPVLVGGRLNPETDNLVGPLARRCLDALAFDAAFFASFALHPKLGPCEPSLDDAEIKQLVCDRSQRHFLAINHHKLGERTTGTWSAPAASILATDLEPGDERLQPFTEIFTNIL